MQLKDILKICKLSINNKISYAINKGNGIYELREYKKENKIVKYIVQVNENKIELLFTIGLLG